MSHTWRSPPGQSARGAPVGRYYHDSRSHLSLDKDAPATRQIQRNKSERIVAISQVGGLHHRYERRVA